MIEHRISINELRSLGEALMNTLEINNTVNNYEHTNEINNWCE
jgi:hypothetical protein